MKYAKHTFLFLILMIILLVMLNGCGERTVVNTGNKKLWVVVEEFSRQELQELISMFESEYNNVEVELDILPVSEEARTAKIEQLRVEIMAGHGPDVYILPVDNLRVDSTSVRVEQLFPDVAQSMYNGLFYDISQYYEADKTMGKETLVAKVMDAGVIEGERYILPLFFNLPITLVNTEIQTSAALDMEILNASRRDLLDAVQTAKDTKLACGIEINEEAFGFNMYSRLIDYESGQVLLTAQEVAEYMRKYQANRVLVGNTFEHRTEVKSNYDEFFGTSGFPLYSYSRLDTALGIKAAAKEADVELHILPVRAIDGSLIADIVYWGAVGAGCSCPDLAYEFLRCFLLEDFQWSSAVTNGWPVRCAEENSYTPVLKEIDMARFSIPQERSVYARMLNKLNDPTNDYAPSDVDIDALAKELIQNLQWHVAEG